MGTLLGDCGWWRCEGRGLEKLGLDFGLSV